MVLSVSRRKGSDACLYATGVGDAGPRARVNVQLESRPRSRSADIHRPIPRHRKIHAASTPRPIAQGPDIHVGALRREHRHVLLALHFGNSCKCLAATPRLPGAAPVTWGRNIPPAIEHHLERQGVAVFKEMKVRARHARHGCQDAGTLAAEHAGSGTRWQRNLLARDPALRNALLGPGT
jgi:hypothetical protein